MSKYKIRLQVIATADDDGSNAVPITPNQITSALARMNQIYTPANLEFVFDEQDDWLKINNTLYNRDFTVFELPNVEGTKWDHEPLSDAVTHSRARERLAKLFRGKLVLIFRIRTTIQKDNGYWVVAHKEGNLADSETYFVNMTDDANADDIAHEIGHYLQLPHTFVKGINNVADAATAIKNYVENKHHSKDEGLDALDGDHGWVLDTPADARSAIFVGAGYKKCENVSLPIPVTFSDHTQKTYILSPNRMLVMSYFKGCPGNQTISDQQARRVRDALELRVRQDLISTKPDLASGLSHGEAINAGIANSGSIALIRAGRIAAAMRDNDGNLKIKIFDINESDDKITEKATATGGKIGTVAVCGIGLNMMATAVTDSANKPKVIIWRVEENGTITRLKDASLDLTVKGIALSLTNHCNIITVSWLQDGTTSVDLWTVTADGAITHRNSGTTGKVLGLGPINYVGNSNFVTYIIDEQNHLKGILWNDDLIRVASATFDDNTASKISGCAVAREISVSAIQGSDNKLKLVSYRFPEDCQFMKQSGTVAGDNCSAVEIIQLGTEMAVTGIRDTSNHLKVTLWQVMRYGDPVVKLKEASINVDFNALSMCQVGQAQFATAVREGNGNIKIYAWHVKPLTITGLLTTAKLIENASKQPIVTDGTLVEIED